MARPAAWEVALAIFPNKCAIPPLSTSEDRLSRFGFLGSHRAIIAKTFSTLTSSIRERKRTFGPMPDDPEFLSLRPTVINGERYADAPLQIEDR